MASNSQGIHQLPQRGFHLYLYIGIGILCGLLIWWDSLYLLYGYILPYFGIFYNHFVDILVHYWYTIRYIRYIHKSHSTIYLQAKGLSFARTFKQYTFIKKNYLIIKKKISILAKYLLAVLNSAQLLLFMLLFCEIYLRNSHWKKCSVKPSFRKVCCAHYHDFLAT